jgi:hypothetical protein
MSLASGGKPADGRRTGADYSAASAIGLFGCVVQLA